jgi:hypothetical protein
LRDGKRCRASPVAGSPANLLSPARLCLWYAGERAERDRRSSRTLFHEHHSRKDAAVMGKGNNSQKNDKKQKKPKQDKKPPVKK